MAEVKNYRVKGKFRAGSANQKFTRELRETSKENALERIYSEIGSKHGTKRSLIKITKIEEIIPEYAKDSKTKKPNKAE